MPRTPEQYEQIREEKRKQIMEVALELFSTLGYHNTPISKIAASAGISKGLMYNYFESKEDLVRSVMYEGMHKLTNFLDPNNDGVLTDEEFEFFVRKSTDSVKENTSYWRLYFSLIMQSGVYELITENYAENIGHMMKLLMDYFRTRGSEDAVSEAIMFGAMMDGISMAYILDPENVNIEKMQKMIIKKFGKNNDQ